MMTNRFCIPMGARYARPSVNPWMNTDSKSTDIPYRPSKAPGIARRTTLLMIAYAGAQADVGCGCSAAEVRASLNAASSSIPSAANLQCSGVMFNVF